MAIMDAWHVRWQVMRALVKVIVFFVGSWLHSPHPSNQPSGWTIVIWVGVIWRFGDCFNVAKFSSCPPAFLRNDTSNLLPRVATQRGRLPLVAKTLQVTLPLCIPPLPCRWQDERSVKDAKHLFGQGRWPCAEFEGAEPSKKKAVADKKRRQACRRPPPVCD